MPAQQNCNNICNAGLQQSCINAAQTAKDSISQDAPSSVVLGKNPCLSTQPESQQFALLGSNENQDAVQGVQTLAQAVRNRGLRLYRAVTLEMTNGTPEQIAMQEYFMSHQDELHVFTVRHLETVTVLTAELIKWAELFDKVFEYFATFGDEWNEYEQGIDLACSMFENEIGSFGLYGFVRSAAV